MEENLFFSKHDLQYCGENVIIGKTVRIRKPQDTIIGDNVIIDDFTYISAGLTIGTYSHIGANSSLIGGKSHITIGSYVNIAPSCQLVAASNYYKGGGLVSPTIPDIYAGEVEADPIQLTDHVLLACNTTVLPGVIMPEGMATGAFSLVTKQVYEEWNLYLGIPCVLYCKREKKEILEMAKMLKISGGGVNNSIYQQIIEKRCWYENSVFLQ